MIATVLRVTLLNLLRDRVALLLTFALPILFFSVFASVFSGMDEAAIRPVLTVVVADGSEAFATGLVDYLSQEPMLELLSFEARDRSAALEVVRRGEAQVAVIVPRGAGLTWGADSVQPRPAVEMLADRSNPLAVGVVRGTLQAGAGAVAQRLLQAGPGAPLPSPRSDGWDRPEPLRVEVVDALGAPDKRPSVAFFAAGLGVLFLMFAVAGRSSILLEERENGILQRLLAARVGLTRLLAGRWLFLVLLGCTQVSVMFVWAAVAFGLDLFTPRHLMGFAAITLPTAAAAAALGLLLSAVCRTRAQLNGVSVVVILILAVLGGNLFPSFLMPAELRELGRLTFNSWALSGYQKVFWYEQPLPELVHEILVLSAWAMVLLVLARLLAQRWERLDR
jgi:ABC-2 type transport system permease protein